MHGRVPRWAVAGLTDPAALIRAVVEPIWKAHPGPHGLRHGAYTPGQRAVYALRWLDAEVRNGGFHQYLWNTSGALAEEARRGALLLGAGAYADLLTEVAAVVFAGGGVPGDRQARQQALEALGENQRRRLAALNDRFSALADQQPLDAVFERYIAAHPQEFLVEEAEEDPVEAARGRLDLAYRLVSRNAPGDVDRARPLLEDALARADALGLRGVQGRCQSLLDQLGSLRLH